MKRTTPRSEWEDIPGFDPVKGEYIRLDGDAWLDAHQIREEGAKRGKQDRPGSEETLPDEMYRKIENWVRKRALACKEAVERDIQDKLDHLHNIASTEEGNREIDVDARVVSFCEDLQAMAERSTSDLAQRRVEYEEAARDFSKFRRRHRLSRVAHYPDNPVAHWLWVPVAMIVESFASANLLGGVSRGGVVEGWTIAILLTVVNVLMGIWAGKMWRLTHYDWGFRKLFACTQVMLCAAIALVWNDMAGHMRDIVLAEETAEAFGEAFATAWRTMIERPLPWKSLSSAGLAVIGVVVFVLTTYKAYTADDIFPGYGAKHRKVEELHELYQTVLNAALDDLRSARNKASEWIEEIKDRQELDRAGWESACDRLRMIEDDYEENLRQYNTDLAYLIAAYRSANLATRKTASPPFFGIEPTIDEDVKRLPHITIPAPPDWSDIPKRAEAGLSRIEEVYNRLRQEHYPMLDRVVEDYVEDTP